MQRDELIFQVSEFNEMVNQHLSLLGEVTVEGEISSISSSKNSFLYLTIKDDKAVLNTFSILFKISGWKTLEEGMKVRVVGSPGIYSPYGKFTLNAHTIKPAGEGSLKLALEKLKKQLEKEGLFDTARKREIPQYPERIGLLTAKGSQAYKDFVKVLEARMGGVYVHYYPVHVQGKDSVSSIVEGFDYFNDHAEKLNLDALVLIRGGGSLEDLISFNDEHVARAIFSSKIPVLCGVGHEGDWSIADEVADLRASTPSNAAELLVRERHEAIREVEYLMSRMERVLKDRVTSGKTLITTFTQATTRLQRLIHEKQTFIDKTTVSMGSNLLQHIDQSRKQVTYYERLLQSLDYHNVLKRGFSVTRDASGKLIRSDKDVSPGEIITTQVARGTITSNVQ